MVDVPHNVTPPSRGTVAQNNPSTSQCSKPAWGAKHTKGSRAKLGVDEGRKNWKLV